MVGFTSKCSFLAVPIKFSLHTQRFCFDPEGQDETAGFSRHQINNAITL